MLSKKAYDILRITCPKNESAFKTFMPIKGKMPHSDGNNRIRVDKR
jgi:hypothetical protein